ncbi:hypothetical protein LCGC14_2417020, partial [marine sediment metagenome]
ADAVVAIADQNGKIKLNQMINLWTMAASDGAFWGWRCPAAERGWATRGECPGLC